LIQITPRRLGRKYSLTNQPFTYLKSIGCPDRRGRLRQFSVRLHPFSVGLNKVEHFSIGGWR
jgi:hypothetical protein